MAYLKIDNVDYSHCVNALNINKTAVYNSQTNAAGNSVVDYINSKRQIEVGIIPLDSEAMKQLQTSIDAFNVSLSFRNPKTGVLEEDVSCIIPENAIQYYTIQVDKVLFNAMTLTFIEL